MGKEKLNRSALARASAGETGTTRGQLFCLLETKGQRPWLFPLISTYKAGGFGAFDSHE